MNYFLISDTHFGHKSLIENNYRQPDYEEILFNNLKGLFNNNDILIHLGDFSVTKTKKERLFHENFTNISDCKKWLIRGNHDKKSVSWYIERGWDFVCDGLILNIYGYNILFSHIPVENNNFFDINIHGHLHNDNHRKYEFPYIEKSKSHILVSMEISKYKPINLKNLIDKYNISKEKL